MVGCSGGLKLLTVFDHARRWTNKYKRRRCPSRRQLITFDLLPDDVLLEIFDFYVQDARDYSKQSAEEWITLAHVCRRWRSVVFQSPIRLDLQLVCTSNIPTRDILDIWPPLPLIIRDIDKYASLRPFIADNVIAALERNDCIYEIHLRFAELDYFTDSAAVLRPFPRLTFLHLRNIELPVHGDPEQTLPDSFLGRSAPRLESLHLDSIPFLGLPKLLLSTTHLVNLHLSDIPRSGYIAPEVMATSLSALTSLEYFRLHFQYPPPRSAQETRRPHPPLPTRSILPNLTGIKFNGANEYLEVILARIDTPRLDELEIAFLNQLIFDTPQLFQFISRRTGLRASETGYITFSDSDVCVKFADQPSGYTRFNAKIWCVPSDWQLSSLEQVCASLPPISTLEDLYISRFHINNMRRRSHWQNDIENTLWLDLLRSFVAVKKLYIPDEFVSRVAPALQELVGGRTMEVLPALENILLEGYQPSSPLQEGIEKFAAARQLASHPIVVSSWDGR